MFERIRSIKTQYKLGFTSGVYDLFHVGHLHSISQCYEQCDYLVIGLLNDPTIDRPLSKEKPALGLYERFMLITTAFPEAIVIPFASESELEDMIATIEPHVRFCGEEYKNELHTGRKLCARLGIPIVYTKRQHLFSSTRIKNQVIWLRDRKD